GRARAAPPAHGRTARPPARLARGGGWRSRPRCLWRGWSAAVAARRATLPEPPERGQRKKRKSGTTGCSARAECLVSAVAVVSLEREVLEEPLLGLPEGDGTQHLLGLLRERDRGDHAG